MLYLVNYVIGLVLTINATDNATTVIFIGQNCGLQLKIIAWHQTYK